MKRKLIAGLTTALLMLSSVGATNASLISQDLSTPGDGLLTYDSSTGLSWLDLTQTYGKSQNDVLSGFGGFTTTLDFRYATGSEVANLLTDAAITGGSSTTWDIININNTRSLINLLGVTYTDGHTYIGLAYIADPNPGVHAVGSLAVNDIGHYYAFSNVLIDASIQNYINTVGAGSFLVKDPANASIPEPAIVLLFGTGIAGLAGTRFGRKSSAG